MSADPHPQRPSIRLSICIATYRRAQYLGQTLDSIVPQLRDEIELIIVDGASPDATADIIAPYVAAYPQLRYYRETCNSGIDRDYDKALSYASGEFCWLMTDDDLLVPGAIDRVLVEIDKPAVDLIVVNARVMTATLTSELTSRLLPLEADRRYDAGSSAAFFREAASYLSFIGGVVVRRSVWVSRDRSSYYGTLFVHVGVIFRQPSIGDVAIVADPLIVIRYGNAMWTARGFEVWLFKWPRLIWSFDQFLPAARAAISPNFPFPRPKSLLWHRAIGSYSSAEYERFLSEAGSATWRLLARAIARLPQRVANMLCALYLWVRLDKAPGIAIYDLARTPRASRTSRALARLKGIA